MTEKKMTIPIPEKPSNVEPELNGTAIDVLNKRYLLKDENDNIIETPAEMFWRVAYNIAQGDSDFLKRDKKRNILKRANEFYDMMMNLEFMPNSPTLMNAGTEIGMLSACFVLPIEDSMESIFETVKSTALIHKAGGGTGFSFSNLRPTNDLVKSTQGVSSGPISFMEVFDKSTDVISQAGKRRGANMGILRIDHPDIMDFIKVKSDLDKLNNFNLSIAITDVFMKAVKEDTDYDIINPRNNKVVTQYNARKVFKQIIKQAWTSGEPGLIFIDEINRLNSTKHYSEIEATNPCVSGDTLIHVADGRNAVPMKQLVDEGKDVPVYCKDNDGNATIRMMRNPRKTGTNKQIIKITIDGGHELRVTDNHKMHLYDGSVVETKDLKNGDRLSIMSKWENVDNGYVNIKASGTPVVAEHRLVGEFFHGDVNNKVVHHKDHVRNNNSPINLEIMTIEDHKNYHMLGENNPMNRFPEKNPFNDPEWQKRNREKYHVGAKRSEETCKKISEKRKEICKDINYINKLSKISKKAYIDNKENYNKGFLKRSKHNLEKYKKTTDLPVFLKGNIAYVLKECEGCGVEFEIKWSKREQSYCSLNCANKHATTLSKHIHTEESIKQMLESSKEYHNSKKGKTNKIKAAIKSAKSKALTCGSVAVHLKLDLLEEKWDTYKEQIRDSGIKKFMTKNKIVELFDGWDNFCHEVQTNNHCVIKIEYDGLEDVYNGTVDDFHNFSIGCFHEESSSKNRKNLMISTTCSNCGELPLEKFNSCNLGSINLSKFVTSDKKVDYDRLGKIVDKGVHFLDNVIEMNNYPLPQIEETTKLYRKIGLGIMGWADLLFKLEIPYSSVKALKLADQVMGYINERAYEYSIKLGEERGVYPIYQKHSHLKMNEPCRNAARTTIAPTGTISIIANCSSGIEPIFSLAFVRRIMDDNEFFEVNPIFDEVSKENNFYSKDLIKELSEKGSVKHIDFIPDKFKEYFESAHDITPDSHIKMQAAFQKHIDSSISKTINFSKTATEEDVRDAYLQAYESGCKGITIYRDGCRDNQVLNLDNGKKEFVVEKRIKKNRPKTLRGTTYEYLTGCGKIFIVVNEDENGDAFEVFCTIGKAGGCASSNCEAIGRLTSLALRSGQKLKPIIKQLSGIRCHMPSGFGENAILSCSDAIAKAMAKHVENRGNDTSEIIVEINNESGACPECGGVISHESGCGLCHACGFSFCG